ncbi:MAG: DUF4139 domain-containing protein [Ignavibacteriaceae bacterium]|nr:DUF4139 domain-containing protein [Ignavibacteriaceae bacterium]
MARIKSIILLSFFAFNISLPGQNLDQKSIAVTVYNANLGVVKDLREMDIKSGTSKIFLTDVAQFIDPTSVHIKLNGEVIEQNYQYDLVSLEKILQKYIDKEIQLIGENNEFIEGKLLSSFGGQIVIEKKGGGLVMIPNTAKYRFSVGSLPDGLITKPTLVWTVNSKSTGKQDVEISYQTSGMNWHAEYVAVLNQNDTKLDLNSWVSVENNSGATYKNAVLKLVAGDVNLITPGRRQIYGVDYNMMTEKSVAPQQFQEKEFFEYHIYNLQQPTTLAQNETKQISLFEAGNVRATKKFFYQSGGYRSYNYGNASSTGKVAVIVEFENKEEYNLGVPMPKGKVRVYKSDGETIEFIGEDMVDHTPNKEKVKLRIGDAFDIVAEEVQTENKKITDRVYEQAYEIRFKNRKKEDIIVEVERTLGFYWEVLSSSIGYEKKDSQNIIFKVPVKADDETVLKFKVRYTY